MNDSIKTNTLTIIHLDINVRDYSYISKLSFKNDTSVNELQLKIISVKEAWST